MGTLRGKKDPGPGGLSGVRGETPEQLWGKADGLCQRLECAAMGGGARENEASKSGGPRAHSPGLRGALLGSLGFPLGHWQLWNGAEPRRERSGCLRGGRPCSTPCVWARAHVYTWGCEHKPCTKLYWAPGDTALGTQVTPNSSKHYSWAPLGVSVHSLLLCPWGRVSGS